MKSEKRTGDRATFTAKLKVKQPSRRENDLVGTKLIIVAMSGITLSLTVTRPNVVDPDMSQPRYTILIRCLLERVNRKTQHLMPSM